MVKERIDHCPHCGATLIGEPIPEAHREMFGGATHFRREIAAVDRELDRCTHSICPDCRKVITHQQLWSKS